MKAVEVNVRTISGLADNDIGVPLMRKAFGQGGPLTDIALPAGEQKAIADLFCGAIGTFKSPYSHRYVDSDAETCVDALIFASRLLHIVDKSGP